MTTKLFSTLCLRDITVRNRIFVSPMCQYSAVDGIPNDWHFVHLGSRAVGGAGLIMVEATGVSPEGRISPGDLGIWNDIQTKELQKVAAFIEVNGAIPAIQIAHAGRKASTAAPWKGGKPLKQEEGGWTPVAPSAVPFSANHATPKELAKTEIESLLKKFSDAAKRAMSAGFKVLELHMAHGYLMHEFLSPLTNHRNDEFGGIWENRTRFPLAVAKAVRAVWPSHLPVFTRISATDWVEGGWDLEQSIRFCLALKEAGIDLIDCSTGGTVPDAKIPFAPGFQVPFSAAIRKEARIPTCTVGFITDPHQAEQILVCEQADAIALGREMLRNPYWPLHAAKKLGEDIPWPSQYERAK